MGKGKKNRKRDTASDDASASTEAAGPTVQAAELKETNEEEGNVAMEAEEVRVGGSEAEASGSEAKKEKKEKEKKSKKREGESEMSAEQTEPEPNENVGGLAGEQPTTADNGDVEGEVGEQVKASEREREVIERENQARARVDTAAVERLSKGFTATLLPTLDALTHRLDECRQAQAALLAVVHDENEQIGNCRPLLEVAETMSKVPVYAAKLTAVRKEMLALHERSQKLKKRTDKLLSKKKREEMAEAMARDRTLAREESLHAVPVDVIIKATDATVAKEKEKEKRRRSRET